MDMDIKINEILEQAQKTLAESGTLNITIRRKIWQAMGPLEPREQDSPVPRTITEPLKTRALLALASAKKVMPMWCTCDSDDKRPQNLIKKSRAYLDGKITVQALNAEVDNDTISDFMVLIDDGEIAAEAAIAAWNAAAVALEDEAALEPYCCDATDEDIDPYDWDAAKNACAAWSDAYTDGDIGKRAVREMRFWAWYLEEAAKLLGVDYRFPPKYIKAFQEKQNPPKPVPKEVTLESLAGFLDLGEYVYHCKHVAKDKDRDVVFYAIVLRLNEDFDIGICPVCGRTTREVAHAGANRRLDWYDYVLPAKGPQIAITQLDFAFRCPEHPEKHIYPPSIGYKNVKAAVKRYLKGAGRLEKLLDELERRKTTKYFKVWGNSIVIDGWSFCKLADIDKKKEELGLARAGWIDEKNEVYGLDLRQYLPIFYIYNRSYEDFMRYLPKNVRENEDGTVDLITDGFLLHCTFENGQPVYAQITSLFRIWVKNQNDPALLKALTEILNLPEDVAEQAIQNAGHISSEWEIEQLTALTRTEVLRVFPALKKAGVKCRMLPDRF